MKVIVATDSEEDNVDFLIIFFLHKLKQKSGKEIGQWQVNYSQTLIKRRKKN